MFGPIPARVYVCHCGWSQYVYGSKSDVLFSEQQVPPQTCAHCGSDALVRRTPTFWERLRHGNTPKF